MKKVYVQDKETGKFVEKHLATQNHSPAVHILEPFVSPIDGTVIRDAAQLRSHNKKHDVTDRRDWGPDWFERKGKELELKRQGLDPESKRERIAALKQATEDYNRR